MASDQFGASAHQRKLIRACIATTGTKIADDFARTTIAGLLDLVEHAEEQLARAQADLAAERERAERWKLSASLYAATASHEDGCLKLTHGCSCQLNAACEKYAMLSLVDDAESAAEPERTEARNDAETCEACGGSKVVRSPEPDGGTWRGPCPRCTKPTEGVG